jgi:hypothetical protein
VPAPGSTYGQLALADLTGDGVLDLVVLDGGLTLTLLPGAGDGTFALGVPHPLSSAARQLVVSDVDGDHATDVVVAGAAKISTFLNDGHGNLGSAIEVTSPPDVRAIALVDYDHDQVLDLVAGGSGVFVWKGGVGTFSDNRRITLVPSAPWLFVRAADVDRDGYPDLVGRTAEGFEIRTGDGRGAFPLAHAFLFQPAITVYPSARYPFTLADLDGDQLPEIVVQPSGSTGNLGAAVLRNISR